MKMYNFKQIASDHFLTFYNYKTNQRYRLWPRYVFIFITSISLAFLFNNGGKEFLDGAVTVQAVLIGFSFNVIFYFASRERFSKIEHGSIEAELRFNKLEQLEREIFYNVLYYNLVAIACILLALLLMVSLTQQGFISYLNSHIQSFTGSAFISVMHYIKVISLKAIQIAFYIALIEGGYTFMRTVIRIGYLFDRRLKSTRSASQA